ncbi:MAG: 23S rRNA pseudouridine(1911/1915/1917) synthase RluD [Pseudomonadota bacterium]
MREQVLEAEVTAELSGRRLDQALAELFSDYSRSRLQKWVKAGRVTLNDGQLRAKDKVHAGDRILVRVESEPLIEDKPQPIMLDIRYEDEHLLVINKPVGLVVHPAAGNRSGTLLNGLLHHDPLLQGLPRAGIVHRLDKETSGLLVVARTLKAHKRLVEMLQAREIHREYRTIVNGVMISGGSVDTPIGRHPTQRTRMAVVHNGKPARTDYRVLQRFRAHTFLIIKLHSGRTHQIRVHMASINHPVVGDPLYGGRLKFPAGASEGLKNALRHFKRQALHAFKLGFEHPETGAWVEWECAMPDDMQQLLTELEHDSEAMD